MKGEKGGVLVEFGVRAESGSRFGPKRLGGDDCHPLAQSTCLPSRRHHWLTTSSFCCVGARNRHKDHSVLIPVEATVVALPFWHPISQSLFRTSVKSF